MAGICFAYAHKKNVNSTKESVDTLTNRLPHMNAIEDHVLQSLALLHPKFVFYAVVPHFTIHCL